MEITYLSGACIVHKKKVLLLHQPKNARHPNLWGPPGGHGEKGETLTESAIREVKEETNLDIEILGLIEGGIKQHKDKTFSVVALYLAKPKNLSSLKIDPTEVADYKWVTLEEIKSDKYKLRDPLLKGVLIKALSQKPASTGVFKVYK